LGFSGDQALPGLPGVSTFKQLGYPDLVISEVFGIDFEAEIAVITGDVPMQTSADDAIEGVRLCSP
jgi:2-keto-4-pentenoate hydratase/2-oxohepta-3-ene-1,7-dioic acid hydratase in catechol pathway